ncbi:hypothetical protein VTK73DRAFT_1291 [Phialemonium thermophilum]|uniref:Uncharacterized protein n=1 Tax=Phialemonium thermophilum TaxID=223376 RepID=A0ABR3VTQ6_9PEZI
MVKKRIRSLFTVAYRRDWKGTPRQAIAKCEARPGTMQARLPSTILQQACLCSLCLPESRQDKQTGWDAHVQMLES